MADFSKQYCEIHDMGLKGDFDIIEEWTKLEEGHYISYICEGYGFLAIGKLEEDLTQPWLYFSDPDDFAGDGHWIKLEDLEKIKR